MEGERDSRHHMFEPQCWAREETIKKTRLRRRKCIVVSCTSCLAFPAVVRGWGILPYTEYRKLHGCITYKHLVAGSELTSSWVPKIQFLIQLLIALYLHPWRQPKTIWMKSWAALGDSASAGVLDLDHLQRTLPTSALPWSCHEEVRLMRRN